jgi:hypothetical protein
MRKYILLCLCLFLLVGCGDKASRDAAREAKESGKLQAFEVDDLHYVVGYGEWDGDTFRIRDIDGRIWDVPGTVKITKEEVTEESFKKRTK